jgi:hypothetical protein
MPTGDESGYQAQGNQDTLVTLSKHAWFLLLIRQVVGLNARQAKLNLGLKTGK